MKDCLECGISGCLQSGKDVLPMPTYGAGVTKQPPEACPNCDGCRKLDFYYCANCGVSLRTKPIGG